MAGYAAPPRRLDDRAATPAAPAAAPAAGAAGIYKQFGSTLALRGVDLTLWPGRCLGLVGRNGAGKSTLVSILSGIYPADSGTVRFDGPPAPALATPGPGAAGSPPCSSTRWWCRN